MLTKIAKILILLQITSLNLKSQDDSLSQKYFNEGRSLRDDSLYQKYINEGRSLRNKMDFMNAYKSFRKAKVRAEETHSSYNEVIIEIDSVFKAQEKYTKDVTDMNTMLEKTKKELKAANIDLKERKEENDKYSYAVRKRVELVSMVFPSYREELIDELFLDTIHSDYYEKLSIPIFEAAKAFENKNLKQIFEIYEKYPNNKYVLSFLDSISRHTIMSFQKYNIPETYYNLDIEKWQFKNKMLMRADSNYVSKIILFDLEKGNYISSNKLEGRKIDFSINYEFAILWNEKGIEILDTNFKSQKIEINFLKIINEYNTHKGVTRKNKKIKISDILSASFLVTKLGNRSNTVDIVINIYPKKSYLLKISQNSNDNQSKVNVLEYFPQYTSFVNKDTIQIYDIYGSENDYGYNKYYIKTSENKWLETTIRKTVNTHPSEKNLSKNYSEYFGIENNDKNESRKDKTLWEKDNSFRILSIDDSIVERFFTNDSNLITLTEKNELLKWNFYSNTLKNKEDLLKIFSKPKFDFTQKIEDIPATPGNLSLFFKYYDNLAKPVKDIHDSVSLQYHRTDVLLNFKIYSITGSSNDKSLLSSSYGSLAWELLFQRKFSEAADIAKLGIDLDSSQTWIYTNLALGYLLSGKINEAKEIYNKFKNKKYLFGVGGYFCEAFIRDFDKLQTALPELKNDSRIEDVRQNILWDCKIKKNK